MRNTERALVIALRWGLIATVIVDPATAGEGSSP